MVFFHVFESIIVCFVLAISDMVHDVDSIFPLPGFTDNKLQFHSHHSYFRKDFQMLLAVNIDHE